MSPLIRIFMAPVLAASLGFSHQSSHRVEATIKSNAALEPLRTNASTHQHEAHGTRVNPCSADQDFCSDAHDHTSLREASSSVSIALYTYNIGNYDPVQEEKIPCLPSNVHGFFLVDVETYEGSTDALQKWVEKGWTVQKVSTIPGTPHVAESRITAKNLKFAPPDLLLDSSKYDWLVTFDSTMGLDPNKLIEFVQLHKDNAVILLEWYWEDCKGYECFETELKSILDSRPEYVSHSKEETLAWKSLLDDAYKHGQIKMPSYWETSIIMRNLKHELSEEVQRTFLETYTTCHTLQRDQFVLPYYMEKNNLLPSTYTARLEELQSSLDFCMLAPHDQRNVKTAGGLGGL